MAMMRALTIMVAAVLAGFAAFAVSGDSGVNAQEGDGIGIGPYEGASVLGAVPVDGSWLEFGFLGVGVPAVGCQPADPGGLSCVPSDGGNATFVNAPPWTFTAAPGGVNITVTDAFNIGDQLEVFDNNISIGLTSAVEVGLNCGSDPKVCLPDPLSSSGTFFVGPGDHSITIAATVSITGQGAAYFSLDAKPEPTPTPTVTPTPEPPVGGIGVFPDSGDSGSSSVAVITGFAAIATAIALAGAAWYARRRWA